MSEDKFKIIDGTYKKDNPHQDIGKSKYKVRRHYTAWVEYEVVANSKDEAEDAVMEHGGIDKIEWSDGYYGDDPVEVVGEDYNFDGEADSDYEKYKQEVIKYNDYPIYFNNIPRNMDFIKEANVDICNRKPDATVINVFDHSRLVLSNREQELQKLNDISKGCMWLQSKMGTINILLSQLNRNIEQEHRAKAQYQPLLTDLFGGDSIGQDAHVVIMLQRPNDLYGITDLYCDEDPIKLLACHIEKNRDGLLGMIPYEAEMSTFTITERNK